ncbi:uncharacterized protein LOC117147910 isoform X3 [Drosophila mauritiana]|uniref:Uncharacterized protein LOC117147910 isoform X3 n=1 Tax=Drosophila mauritiana TaxID=7226 RepID=A0A6P8L502_DROMA|nr:uncharacterized protein LOC117147910 isoform X3 [Drosophila mauritiana]
MGKKNSKLKQDTIDRLTTDTYFTEKEIRQWASSKSISNSSPTETPANLPPWSFVSSMRIMMAPLSSRSSFGPCPSHHAEIWTRSCTGLSACTTWTTMAI